MTKIKNKTTGELCDVDSTYADRIKQKVTVYLKHGNGKIDTVPLETLMKEYEVAPELTVTNATKTERPKTVYDLKIGDQCYVISGTLITTSEWADSEGQRLRRDVGDITLTKEEAEKKVAWKRAKAILERDTKGFKPEWANGDQPKYDVWYNHSTCELLIGRQYFINYGTIAFATLEDAQASIKAHPNEWKTYLGVEE